MRKLLSVSIVAMLAVSPMMAHAAPVALDPQNSHGPTNDAGGPVAGANAPFAAETIYDTDATGVASAAYVKGAYNASIRAINKVNSTVSSLSTNLDSTIKSKINSAAGDGLTTSADGVLAIGHTDSTITVSADGIAVGTITTSNLEGSLATGLQTGAENTKLATKGYADSVASDTLDSAKSYADGLATNYDAAGSATAALNSAKSYADGLATNYDAAGSAAAALTSAQTYADTAAGNALDSAKSYADGLATNYDAAGSATAALNSAKSYADGLATNYDAAGSAAAAETAAKGYADSLATNYDAAGSAAAAQAAAESYVDSVTANMATQSGVVATINSSAVNVTAHVPMFAAWGDTTAGSASVVIDSASLNATTSGYKAQ